jgi:hypothetical protein
VFARNEKELDDRKRLLTERLFKIVNVKLLDTPPKLVDKKEALSEGVHLFNEERFWECHEILEQAWHVSKGAEREAIQSMILTAAAFVHYQKGENEICLSILKRAKAKMELAKTFAPVDFAGLQRNVGNILDLGRIQLFKIQLSRI